MIIWYSTAAIVLIVFLANLVAYIRRHHYPSASPVHTPLFSMLRERDLFYMPGDKSIDDDEDYD